MIVERDIYTKENTNPNSNNAGNSDDSYSGASFPWFPSQNRRKSRLGTYRKERIRVLQDVPNIDVPTECGPATLNQEAKADERETFPCEPVFEAQCTPPQSTSVSAFQPIVENSPFVDNFELQPTSSMSLPFCSFEPALNIYSPMTGFKTPSLSPRSTSMEGLESMCSFSVPSGELKFSNLSSHLIPADYQSNCKISPPTNDFQPSKSSSSTPARKFFPHDRSVESGFFSDHEFKIPITSPTPAPPISNLKPFTLVKESNSVLKSSLKKPNCPISDEKVTVEQAPCKPPESSPRKEVRFAEPAPLPKNTTQKPEKLATDLPSSISVKNKTYRVWRELGTGGSCVVYEVFDSEANDSLAIKRVLLPEDEDLAYVAEGYLEEVKMLEKLRNCDNIIKIYDHELVYENGRRVLYVVLEKGEMDLSKYMRTILKENKLFYILLCWGQMLMAVSKIHDEDIIHLDLKPANFLFVKGKLKLIDFGIASAMPGDKTSIYLNATSGTLSYTSPESLSMTHTPVGSSGYRISKKSDVWSLGCILYRWIYGHVPFQTSLNKWQRLQDIMAPDKKVEFPDRADIPESLLRTVQSCLEKDPKKRPTVKELLQVKWNISFDQYMS